MDLVLLNFAAVRASLEKIEIQNLSACLFHRTVHHDSVRVFSFANHLQQPLSCLCQVVFALIAPNQVVANLAAGAIAEAGAQQAGDMMQVSHILWTPRSIHPAVGL